MEVVCSNNLCGRVFTYRGGPAHLKRSKSHCCSRKCQNTTHGLAGTKRHEIWERTKRRAKKDGTIFALTVQDIPHIPEKCPILGIKIVANTKAGPIDSSPSIDRILPSLGYVPNNIRIISNRANRLRSDATSKELRLLAEDIEGAECKSLQ